LLIDIGKPRNAGKRSKNCLLEEVIEGKIEGNADVTGRRGIRCKQLLYDLKGKKGYWKLKDEALDRTL